MCHIVQGLGPYFRSTGTKYTGVGAFVDWPSGTDNHNTASDTGEDMDMLVYSEVGHSNPGWEFDTVKLA